MNNDQLLAYGRQFLTIFGTMLGTYLVSTGKISAANLTTLGGAVTTIGGALFTIAPIVVSLWKSFTAHSVAGKAASADKDPAVAKMVLQPTPANAAIASKLSNKVTV